jgi:hypothetical protein
VRSPVLTTPSSGTRISLKLLYDFFDQARRGGLASLEAEIEDPSKSKTLAS